MPGWLSFRGLCFPLGRFGIPGGPANGRAARHGSARGGHSLLADLEMLRGPGGSGEAASDLVLVRLLLVKLARIRGTKRSTAELLGPPGLA